MTLTMKRETKEERRARWRFLPARLSDRYETNDPSRHTNDEMLAILERHARTIIEAAKKAGLDVGDEYEWE